MLHFQFSVLHLTKQVHNSQMSLLHCFQFIYLICLCIKVQQPKCFDAKFQFAVSVSFLTLSVTQPMSFFLTWLQTLTSQQRQGPALPGQQHKQMQQAKNPHILVCAPSNAGIDEIARRLIKESLATRGRRKCSSSTDGGQKVLVPYSVSL